MKKKKRNKLIEKTGAISSTLSGTMSFLGGYQVCHNLCIVIITLLSIIGITVVGMPLLFLNKVAIPFWTAAVVLLVITLIFYFKKGCISKSIILFNTGIIIAGIPFQQLKNFTLVFWIVGGTLIIVSILLYIKSKLSKEI